MRFVQVGKILRYKMINIAQIQRKGTKILPRHPFMLACSWASDGDHRKCNKMKLLRGGGWSTLVVLHHPQNSPKHLRRCLDLKIIAYRCFFRPGIVAAIARSKLLDVNVRLRESMQNHSPTTCVRPQHLPNARKTIPGMLRRSVCNFIGSCEGGIGPVGLNILRSVVSSAETAEVKILRTKQARSGSDTWNRRYRASSEGF